MINIIENYKHIIFDKYAEFNGRASRREFWYFVLANFIISFVLGVVEGLLSGTGNMAAMRRDDSDVANIYSLVVLVPSLAVAARRLHDIDKSGWWMLVPLYNIYLFFQRGKEGPNRFDTPSAAPASVAPPNVAAETPAPTTTTPEESAH